MKLAILMFDDMITVPDGKRLGSDMLGDACESTFRALDGWDLTQTTQGVFTIQSACMSAPLTVGGHGYRYIPEAACSPLGEIQVQGICPGCKVVIDPNAAHCGAKKCRRAVT